MNRLKVLLDGQFFTYTEYELGLQSLADFSGVEVSRLSFDPEDLAIYKREVFKQKRKENVNRIQVTTSKGNTFDGDETSQARMDRAIRVLQYKGEGFTATWVLSDNRVIQVGADELAEALYLAGEEQTRLWTPSEEDL